MVFSASLLQLVATELRFTFAQTKGVYSCVYMVNTNITLGLSPILKLVHVYKKAALRNLKSHCFLLLIMMCLLFHVESLSFFVVVVVVF